MVKPIPEGFHTVTPYLIVQGAGKLIDYLKAAFDAQEEERHAMPDGSVMHAQVRIGDSPIMMGEAHGEWKAMPSCLHMYVTDVDGQYKQALAAGGKSLREPTNEFYGDRSAGVADPCGNSWFFATHVEDVSPEEMQRRQDEFMKQQKT